MYPALLTMFSTLVIEGGHWHGSAIHQNAHWCSLRYLPSTGEQSAPMQLLHWQSIILEADGGSAHQVWGHCLEMEEGGVPRSYFHACPRASLPPPQVPGHIAGPRIGFGMCVKARRCAGGEHKSNIQPLLATCCAKRYPSSQGVCP